MSFIKISQLTKQFGAFQALKGIDIDIEEREFVTLLGPSGCGKTTTLRILAGFVPPDGGSVSVGGTVLSSRQQVVPPEKRRMGMVFQNYAVWPHMSVFENVAFGLKVTKLPREDIRSRVDRVLASLGLGGLEARHPGQLSGGQQQRVALARSLVVEPSILLLDEPLSNLDAKLREHMRTELKELQRRTGITFVYVTHDQVEAMALSDRIAVFRKGRVEQIGAPREIYERPASLFVADFMGQVNKLPADPVGRAGDTVVLRLGAHTLRALPSRSLEAGGGPVMLTVRPEAVHMAVAEGEGEMNHLEGTVVEAIFLGNLIDYQIEIGEGLRLRAQASRQSVLAVGTKLKLGLAVRECVAMREEAEPAEDPTWSQQPGTRSQVATGPVRR